MADRDGEDETAQVFEGLIGLNAWLSTESNSGVGSELRYTESLRSTLPHLLHKLRVRKLLDIPCGDWNWMRTVELNGVQYVGADIVQALVDANRERYGRNGVSFARLDVVDDALPKVDLVLCRDCLVHLPDEAVHSALANIERSRCRFVLLTTFPDRSNIEDIRLGEWRPLNLEAHPFNLPPPRLLIDERFTGDEGRYTDKSLGLWKRRDLRRAMRRRTA